HADLEEEGDINETSDQKLPLSPVEPIDPLIDVAVGPDLVLDLEAHGECARRFTAGLETVGELEQQTVVFVRRGCRRLRRALEPLERLRQRTLLFVQPAEQRGGRE